MSLQQDATPESGSEGSVDHPKRKRARRIALACNVRYGKLMPVRVLTRSVASRGNSDAIWRAEDRMILASHVRKLGQSVSCKRSRQRWDYWLGHALGWC